MANIREQNYLLNRQFSQNLNLLKEQARQLHTEKSQTQHELEMMRQ
jgi:hypothetical protein